MISASLQQRKTRTRRSMLFVHGANAAMVSNSFIYPADALMFDLEDSVALREKTPPAAWFTTRCNIRCIAILKPLCVSTRWIPNGVLTTEAVVRGGADVVRLPKTDTAQDVLDIEKRSCVSKKPVVVNPAAPACWRRLNLRWGLPAQWKSLTLPSV